MLISYTDRLSVRPRTTLRVMVSTDASEVRGKVVRVRAGELGDDRMARYAVDEQVALGSAPGTQQRTRPGSHMSAPDLPVDVPSISVILRAWPTRVGGDRQALAAVPGLRLALNPAGAPMLASIDGEALLTGEPLSPREWHLIIASRDESGSILIHQRALSGWEREATTATGRGDGVGERTMSLAAFWDHRRGLYRDHYDGKLADPLVLSRALDAAEAESLADLDPQAPSGGVLAAWDLGANPGDDHVPDQGPLGLHGRLANAPTTAVTGPRWDGRVHDWRFDPDGYSAVHFHGDDLDDAGWSPVLSWAPPDDTPSGLYAIQVETLEGGIDRAPFIVAPPRGRPGSRVAVVLPTLTYLAYANERLGTDMVSPAPGWQPPMDPLDDLLACHPEWGRSLYDTHEDGSGVVHSSILRPIPNLRLDYRCWFVDTGRHLGGDLFLLNWLERSGVQFDLLSDHDLNELGWDAIRGYEVVITGSHPEYVSRTIRDSLETFLHSGGRLMYLGGNGFYWVADVCGDRGHRMEVRRGLKGTRAWESAPGEEHHAASGELGGLWRHRGQAPNALVGVGFTAQGWDGCNRAYRATPSAEAYPWVFDGIDRQQPFGAHGRSMNGAAGDEIDRADPACGTPARAVVLATARGFSDAYQLVVEDVPEMRADTGGSQSPLVRADLTMMTIPGGGAVFSTGSIAWSAALEDERGSTDIGRITGNVLERFLDPAPVGASEDEVRSA